MGQGEGPHPTDTDGHPGQPQSPRTAWPNQQSPRSQPEKPTASSPKPGRPGALRGRRLPGILEPKAAITAQRNEGGQHVLDLATLNQSRTSSRTVSPIQGNGSSQAVPERKGGNGCRAESGRPRAWNPGVAEARAAEGCWLGTAGGPGNPTDARCGGGGGMFEFGPGGSQFLYFFTRSYQSYARCNSASNSSTVGGT